MLFVEDRSRGVSVRKLVMTIRRDAGVRSLDQAIMVDKSGAALLRCHDPRQVEKFRPNFAQGVEYLEC